MIAFLKRTWQALDDRGGFSKLFGPFFTHPVPPGVGWGYVFGSGTLFAFIIQVVTGIALAASYIPSTGDAYDSLQFITHEAFLGGLLRGIHYFSASAMILFVGMHLLRTFVTGSYKFPRELNWLSGVLLLGLTVAMGFTGQLLRWDQNAVWTVVVAAEQAGRFPIIGDTLARFILAGDTMNGATLSRFFAVHVFFVPAIIFGILGLHLYLVLHHGISEPPKAGEPVDPKTYREKYNRLIHEKGKPFWPYFVWRDMLVVLAMILVVVGLAVLFGAPELGNPPDPSNLQAVPRPDWYLLWIFAALALIPPQYENLFIVLAPTLGGLILFLLPFIANKGERSPLRRPWAIPIVAGVVLMVGGLWIAGINSNWSPDFAAQPLPAQVVNSSDPSVVSGAQVFYQKGCEYCHTISGNGGKRGPDLSKVGDRLTGMR
jgi:ubiquinol-cytochrome c reductase cytochrome b subunit